MSIASPPSSPRRDEGALTPYVRAVRHHPWLVVSVALVAVLASLAWMTLRAPQYEATAQILVTTVSGDLTAGLPVLTESNDPTRTLQTAATVLSSPRAAVDAARALGRGATPAELQSAVEITAQGDSNVVAVTATADNAEKAVAFADAAANAALQVRRDSLVRQVDAQLAGLEARRDALGESDPATSAALAEQIAVLQTIRDGSDPNFSLLQNAGGAEQIGTPAWMVLALGLMAGIVIAIGAALALEQLDRRIRDEDGLLEVFPLPVLTRVPVTRRRLEGSAPGISPPAVREAFRTLQVQLEGDGERSRVLMLTSASAGDGKTTSAIDLATALAAAGRRVLLLDLDLRKPDVGGRLGVASDRLALFRTNGSLANMVVPVPSISGLRVLSSPMRGDVLPVLDALSRRLPELLAEARELADYVIIDTAPVGRVSDALRIATVADHLLLVARPGNTNTKDLVLARELLQHMGITPTGMVIVGATGSTHGYYGGPIDEGASELGASSLAAVRPAAARARRRDDELDVAT